MAATRSRCAPPAPGMGLPGPPARAASLGPPWSLVDCLIPGFLRTGVVSQVEGPRTCGTKRPDLPDAPPGRDLLLPPPCRARRRLMPWSSELRRDATAPCGGLAGPPAPHDQGRAAAVIPAACRDHGP